MKQKALLLIPAGLLLGYLLASQWNSSVRPGTSGNSQDLPKMDLDKPVNPTNKAAFPPTPPLQSRTADIIANLAAMSQDLGASLSATDIQEMTKDLTAKDYQDLRSWALSPAKKSTERQAALYLLTQSGTAAVAEIAEVAKAPIPVFENRDNPHSVGAMAHKLEVSLRITALESLDLMAVTLPEMNRYLNEILTQQKEPTLVFMTNVSIAGLQEGRPGKLHRAIEAMIKEKQL